MKHANMKYGDKILIHNEAGTPQFATKTKTN